MDLFTVIILVFAVSVVVRIIKDKSKKDIKKHAEFLYSSIMEKELKRIKESGGRGKDAKEARDFLNELDKISSFVKRVTDNPDDYPNIRVGGVLEDWVEYLDACFWIKETHAPLEWDREFTRQRVLEMQERRARLLRLMSVAETQ